MEKGFNDDELADIMNEIENLEKEFGADGPQEEGAAAPAAEQPSPEAEEPIAESQPEEVDLEQVEEAVAEQKPESNDQLKQDLQASIDEEVSEVLEDLAEQPEEKSVPVQQKSAPSNVTPIHAAPSPNVSSAYTKMNFHVEGDMKMEMSFSVGGEEISLAISENDGFVITMASGARFNVPMSKKSAA